MFKDEQRHKVWNDIRQQGLRPFAGILTDEVLAQAAERAQTRLGKGPLSLPTMVWLGVTSALHTTKSFACILSITFKLLSDVRTALGQDTEDQCKPKPVPRRKKSVSRSTSAKKKPGPRSKHDPRGSDPQKVSEEAFVQARRRAPMAFWIQLLSILGLQFQKEHDPLTRWKGFRLLALDGSDIPLPYYAPLVEYFGTCKNGRRARTVQARMVMLGLAQVRLPWRYELVPQSCHEQTAAGRLLQQLQANDLVLMDRGFWSFGLFHLIQRQGAHFGIRLRRGVKFKRLHKLGNQDWLVRWTPAKRSKKKCSWKSPDLPKSIQLRVINYQIPGFRPTAVVTSVLDPKVLSRPDWVQMATQNEAGHTLGLYHRRWEIETMFFELKVTQGMEGNLRSRTREGIEYEVAGHVLLYFMTRWLMVKAAVEHKLDPLRLSFTHALRELEDLRSALLIADQKTVVKTLLPLLLSRIAQHVVPARPGRHYPRPSDKYAKGKYRLSSKQMKSVA